MAVILRWTLLLIVVAHPGALAQTGTLTIRGLVIAAHDRAALPRARVTVVAGRATGPSTYTDDRGRFEIEVPSGAAVSLSVIKAGFAATQVPLEMQARAAAQPPELAIALTLAAAVNGRVVDPSGETVVGQRVYADRLDPDPTTPSSLVKFSSTTDDRGEYRLGGLPPGRYSVTATGALDPGAVATLVLLPGDNLVEVTFTVLPPLGTAARSSPQPPETRDRATIRGRVMTTMGRPIPEAFVTMTGPMPPRQFLTDGQGRFVFTGLIPGDYEVRATRGDFLPGTIGQQTAFESSSRIAVTGAARVDGVTLVLSRGLAVSGTIVDRAGEPMQGVAVQALQLSTSGDRRRAALAGAQVGGRHVTDDRGRYRVFGLQPGSYVVAALADTAALGGGDGALQTVPIYFPGSASIANADAVDVGAADVENVNFPVGDVPLARVTGVAVDSTGAPLQGTIQLAVSQRSGSIVPAARTTTTGPDGSFSFAHVAPGDYVLQAANPQVIRLGQFDPRADPLEAMELAAQYVAVGDQDVGPVSLRTGRGAVLEARIATDSATPHDPYGRMQIQAHPVDVDLAPAFVAAPGGLSRVSDGRLRIGGLTGPRRLVLSGVPDGWYLKSMTIGGVDVTDQIVDFGVGAGGTMSANVVISASGGAIAGRVVRKQRTAALLVVVFPEDREKWFERSRFVKVVRTSQDGAFRASSLPPGDYYVAATAIVAESEATTPGALEQLRSRAVRVTVDEGEERGVNLP
jgi:protocatechuate 3,4-dioxygenase beta subunit